MKKLINQKNTGFSLIETLFAVAILMIAITGPLALVQAGLFSANHERNQITATYLAQEAIEFIRSIRDSNSYKQYDGSASFTWLDGPNGDGVSMLTSCGGVNGCLVDPHKGLVSISGNSLFLKSLGSDTGSGSYLYKKSDVDGTFMSYGYDTSGSATLTSFTRNVIISQVGSDPNEVNVRVKITWKDNSLLRNYEINENLMNYEIADPETP